MSNYLVTGAGGFIGGHIVKRLRAEGHKVRAVDKKPFSKWYQIDRGEDNLTADLMEEWAPREVTRNIDVVINLAADMGGIGYIEHNKIQCMRSVLINTNLLEAAALNGVKQYFFSSSACVYAADKQQDHSGYRLREEDAYPAMPEDGYGWEKLFSERMCKHYTEAGRLSTVVARFHNVYGPYGTWDGGREKAPAAICRKVAQAVVSGDHTISVWGDGEQVRSFMYIDDCVEGVFRLLKADYNEPINLGSDQSVSINQLIDIVSDIAGVKLTRKYDTSAPQGVPGRNSNNERIQQVLGWQPSTSLVEGLKTTYAWIFEQVKTKHLDPSVP